jgi:hypothetical protein
MYTLTIPELYCPFPSRINPFVQDAHQHTLQWVQRFRLYTGAGFKKFIADNFASMTARFYPTADKQRLCLANDVDVLLFAMDDIIEQQRNKTGVEHFGHFMNSCLAILYDPGSHRNATTGIFAAFRDVWQRLQQVSSPGWQQHFARSIAKLFAVAQEKCLKATDHLPSIAGFYKQRPYEGAPQISTDLITVIENIVLPEAILEHHTIVELTMLARKAVCWANDLFSLSKEMEQADPHNMVLVAKQEKGLTLPDAIKFTAYLHDNDMTRFVRMATELPSFGPHDADLRRYVYILSAILKGNIDWSITETARYTFRYANGMVEKP